MPDHRCCGDVVVVVKGRASEKKRTKSSLRTTFAVQILSLSGNCGVGFPDSTDKAEDDMPTTSSFCPCVGFGFGLPDVAGLEIEMCHVTVNVSAEDLWKIHPPFVFFSPATTMFVRRRVVESGRGIFARKIHQL